MSFDVGNVQNRYRRHEHLWNGNMANWYKTILAVAAMAVAASQTAWAAQTLQTRFAQVQIDDQGFITSMTARQSGKEYSPAGHPSPLLSLHENGQPNDQLIQPASATFHGEQGQVELKYPNGATAIVRVGQKDDYFRFQLVSLAPRGTVDNVVWGPLHTTIAGKIGDLIGVVRNDDWAIGMLGLDDNTITGPVEDSDCYEMGYYIHSPDPAKWPVPAKYHEGQWFNIGGNGADDYAFYSHPEEYFNQVFGSGAKIEPEFGSTVVYHSRDRRRSYTHYFSLLPGFKMHSRKHMVSDPVEGVDFIGSGIALYACPDDLAPVTMEKITTGEGLPHVVIDGKWIRDPSAPRPIVYWNGPVDKAIAYAKAAGFKDISRDTGLSFPPLGKEWSGRVGFSNGHSMTYKEFAEQCAKEGLTHGGLHTMCMFLQSGSFHEVTPIPSEHLQTVLRTTLAKGISATDTDIIVTDPSFLAERDTWPKNGDGQNYIRVGTEMMTYSGISESAPWTLTGVKRGHASKAVPHDAGDELVKLQQNCSNGFVPDMTLLLDYAQYYGEMMVRNGMTSLCFDGLESTVYQNHGYYAVRIFMRRLFDTYYKLTGKYPRITGSNVFAGAWEYMDACNLGKGNGMFNVVTGRWNIEGKDIRNGFENSYFPGTFGIQEWHSDWSLYDAENLEAKSIGWFATYALSASADAIDKTGQRDEILKAFHAWEAARAANVFTKEQKLQLQNPDYKFHLEQTGDKTFVLHPVKEIRISEQARSDVKQVAIANPHDAQPLQFALQVNGSADGATIVLPDGSQIKSGKIGTGQFIVCKGDQAFLADPFRKKIADLPMAHAALLPSGESKIGIAFTAPSAKLHFEWTTWIFQKPQEVGK